MNAGKVQHSGTGSGDESDDTAAVGQSQGAEGLGTAPRVALNLELTTGHGEVFEQPAETVVHVGCGVVKNERSGLVDEVAGESAPGIAGVGDHSAKDIEIAGGGADTAGEIEGAGTDLGGVECAQDSVVESEESAVEAGVGIVQTKSQRAAAAGVVGDVPCPGELAEDLIKRIQIEAAGAGHGEGGSIRDGVGDTQEDRAGVEGGGTGVVVHPVETETAIAELRNAGSGADHRGHDQRKRRVGRGGGGDVAVGRTDIEQAVGGDGEDRGDVRGSGRRVDIAGEGQGAAEGDSSVGGCCGCRLGKLNRGGGKNGGDGGARRDVRAGDPHAHREAVGGARSTQGERGVIGGRGGVSGGDAGRPDGGRRIGAGGVKGDSTEAAVAPQVQRAGAVDGEVGTGSNFSTLAGTVGQGGIVDHDAACRRENHDSVGAQECGAGVDDGAAGVGVWRGESEETAARAAQDKAGGSTGESIVNDPGIHRECVLVVGDEQLLHPGGERPGTDAAAVGSCTDGVVIGSALQQAAGDKVQRTGGSGECEVKIADDVEAVQLVARHGRDRSSSC